MRKLTVLMQTTLDGRISNADGLLWQPSAWGEEETAGTSRDSDVQDSPTGLEFARLVGAMRKVVPSRTWPTHPD